ncbi:hypothetical protein K439DRAFT_1537255 [Ramaria rubella]|nr:hypothetical protein K439DRAFT_1537255 [Ramaria rubella]
MYRYKIHFANGAVTEVERAASLIRDVANGKIIEQVETMEDKIVYSGITHDEFADSITGRKVIDVGRYGKVFYITLGGKGPHPVLHLGMTGMLQVQGQEPTYYRTKPRDNVEVWPPRFMKVISTRLLLFSKYYNVSVQFILHIAATATSPPAQLAFLDARRLGRIRLCAFPLTEPPISNLGFDPILCMPSLECFIKSVQKRTCPIKALLLDQSFSAGVGNWIADEILYQARVHPEQRANTLTDIQLANLHDKTTYVCRTAVDVNADSSRFPEDWLFKHRWGKGKKVKHTLLLPNGQPATIKWSKVGGRTSAFIVELQQLTGNNPTLPKVSFLITLCSMKFDYASP